MYHSGGAMSTHTAWPDRAALQVCATKPAQHFDIAELQEATFTSGRWGLPMVWSGGRAMVVRANPPGGRSVAVRFLMHDNPDARTRYEMLRRHLARHSVPCMVDARWVQDGLRVNGQRYPIMIMDWVEGDTLDTYISQVVATASSSAALGLLADQWRDTCRSLQDAGISHGDIHAGNTLVRSDGLASVHVSLVDYDNVWVPELKVPCREAGQPAFQHPGRPVNPRGMVQDAFPNTVTYLSLIALAHDPELWAQYHPADNDRLLFHPADLKTPGDGAWPALLGSSDTQVRALAGLTRRWLGNRWDAYSSLEHVLADLPADGRTRIRNGPRRDASGPNVWPPRDAVENPPWPHAPIPNQGGESTSAWANRPAGNRFTAGGTGPHQTWSAGEADRIGRQQSWKPGQQVWNGGGPTGNHRRPATPGPRGAQPSPTVPESPSRSNGSMAVVIVVVLVALVIVGVILGLRK